MGMTLLLGLGDAKSFLLMFVYVAALFGVPILLLALRLMEVISEERHDRKAKMRRESERELAGLDENLSTSEPEGARHIISAHDMKNA